MKLCMIQVALGKISTVGAKEWWEKIAILPSIVKLDVISNLTIDNVVM